MGYKQLDWIGLDSLGATSTSPLPPPCTDQFLTCARTTRVGFGLEAERSMEVRGAGR